MKLKFANALSLALIVAMLFTSVALADNVVNDVTIGGTDTFTLPGSTTIGYKVNANGGDGQSGCNASDGTPVSVTINTPPGVTATPSALSFNYCGNPFKNVTFTASTSGNYVITASAVDSCVGTGCGTYNTSGATFTLHVLPPPNTAPTLNLPGNLTAEATSAAGAVVTYSATSTDAEDNPDPTPSCSPASGLTFPLGSTTVNCSVTDSGGKSASGSFTVTVQDTTAPALNLPSPITAEATSGSGAAVSYTASATDLVDGSVTLNCSPVSGATFPLGNTTVNCSASDSRGNGASGSFSVVVADTTGPDLSLPANITEEASGPSGNAITYSASATDAVDGNVSVSCTPPSGSTFPIAATTVNCSATDAAGNTANGSFSVTVADTTAPVIAAHGDETAEATGPTGAIRNYTSPATSDAVDGTGVATCSPASGSTFPLGETVVTCNASDAAGNAATPTTFKVKVVDTTDHTIAFDSRTPANAEGWNKDDVTVNWTCSDAVGVLAATVSQTVSTEGEDQSATGTCTDTSGNTASDTQHGINIDKTAPSISANRVPAANANGWNKTDVTASYNASDALSGLASPATDSFVFSSEGAGQFHTFTVSDKAGNTASATVSDVNIDKTAPSISGATDRAANAAGWYNADVTVSFSCNDALSGIASCSSPQTLGEGANQSASGTTTDQAGNSANTTVSGINIDKTKPTISAAAMTSPNGNGWYNGDVTVKFTCDDTLSGIPGGTCPGDQLLNSEGAAVASTAQTVIDTAGNTSDPSNVVTVSIDKTPPTANATASPAANANGWNNSAVTVSFSGSDALSDIDFCDEDAVLSSEGAGQLASGTCTDKAGNVSAPAGTTVNIDLTAPNVALVGGPANGATYYFGAVPAAPTCNASDALSGLVAPCSVSGYSNAIGAHTVSTSATDKADNSAGASASYTVLAWTLKGFYQPVDMNGVVNTVKGGSTVPLKFEVFAGTTELTNTAIVSTLVKQVTCNATSEDTVEVLATGGTSLRYDSTSGQFIFNWQTPKLPGKCYSVTLTTQDGSSITALFKLK